MNKIFPILLLVLITIVPATFAQDGTTTEDLPQSGVEILWPPPVTEVWGTGDVIGTAAVPGMSYYYLEYLPLNEDFSRPEGAPWIPVTVSIEEPVVNGKLATLDTTTVPDGLYALRLVVNTTNGESFFYVTGPVRVNNERFNLVTERLVEGTLDGVRDLLAEDGIDLDDYLPPVETPEPEPDANAAPRAVPAPGYTAVNARRCDVTDNYACAIVGTLTEEGAEVTGLSSTGSGWYLIELQTGQSGWVSPVVTQISGDLSNLPRVRPPAPLPPPATAAITLNGIAPQGTPTCGEPFNVQVNVANTGNAVSEGGTVTLQDVSVRTGDINFTGYGAFPSINPGQNFLVLIPVTTDVYYGEAHELRAYIGDQRITTQYTLEQGDCGTNPDEEDEPTPEPTPVDPFVEREIPAGQCFIVLSNPKAVFDTPYGNPQGTLEPAPYEASIVRETNGVLWYRVNPPAFGQVWISDGGIDKQGNCSL